MLFFELIQVALGRKDKLSRNPTEEEWGELYLIAQKQALVGVTFHALDKISQEGQRPPKHLLYEWIGRSEQIRQRNRLFNKRCRQLQQKMEEAGCASSILKGQGVALYYEEPLQELRQSGDIDVYVDGGRKKVIAIAKQFGVVSPKWDYKHLHLDIWPDTQVEMHYRVEVMLNLQKNKKLQKWFWDHTEELFGHTDSNVTQKAQKARKDCDTQISQMTQINNSSPEEDDNQCTEIDKLITPTLEFNVFYILLHIYRHFLYEGVGLRQIMDYYFVLKRFNENVNLNEDSYAVKAVDEFGMTKFARGLMWVMQEVFAMPADWMICKADEKEGRYILSQVMEGGNFGHHDQRLQHGGGKWNTVKQVCKHNWHLMSHYPADVVWAPAWFVWHKGWKLTHS